MDTEKKDQSNTELEIIRQDLGEEYTDIRELKNGRGGLGNLYRARHVRLDVQGRKEKTVRKRKGLRIATPFLREHL